VILIYKSKLKTGFDLRKMGRYNSNYYFNNFFIYNIKTIGETLLILAKHGLNRENMMRYMNIS